MQLAANVSWLYRHLDEAERFAAAAADGFEAVEILMPYAQTPAWYDQQLRAAGVALVLINTPTGAGPGRLGWAAVPGAEAEFAAAFAQARAVAQATGCGRIHVMAGAATASPQAERDRVLRHNLERALRWSETDGLLLTLEPLNRTDMPGYHYHWPEHAVAVLREFASPRLRLQFDYYHVVMEGLDAMATVRACAPWIGHVQIAGAQGRYEPELARDGLLEAVAALPGLGYDSWLGCEHQPRTTPAEGLRWCEPLRQRGVVR